MEVFQFHQWDSARLSALSNLNAVRLSVSELHPNSDPYALTVTEIRQFVKGMLKIAAVPLEEDGAESDEPGGPARLHAAVTVMRVADLYSVRVEVEMRDRVWLMRHEGHAIDATTWKQTAEFVSNRHELRATSRQELGKVLTRFLNDFLAVNQQVLKESYGGKG